MKKINQSIIGTFTNVNNQFNSGRKFGNSLMLPQIGSKVPETDTITNFRGQISYVISKVLQEQTLKPMP